MAGGHMFKPPEEDGKIVGIVKTHLVGDFLYGKIC